MNTHSISRLAVVAAAALLLAGCAAPAPQAQVAVESDSVSITDAWVKSAEEGMSAAFGVLGNDGAADVTIVSASTEASPMVELHETVANDAGEMVMQPKAGGIPVKAGGSATLEPGGDHIMLMELTGPVKVGDDVALTLTFDDGTTLEVTAPAKEFDGGNESYEPSPSESMSM